MVVPPVVLYVRKGIPKNENFKAVELSYVPLYHAVYSLYGAFFGIFHYPNVYL